MADIKNFTGFAQGQSARIATRGFVGFSQSNNDNFSVRVFDNLGTKVVGADVFITFGGNTITGVTDESGAVTVELQSAVSVISVYASLDCLRSPNVISSYPGTGFVQVDTVISELPCLSSQDVNEYNLVRWKQSNNLVFPLSGSPSMCTNCGADDFTSASKYVNSRLSKVTCSWPLIVAGETLRYCINQRIPNLLGDNLAVALVSADNQVISNSVGDVVVSPPDINNQVFLYFEWTVPDNVLEHRFYNLQIYDVDTNQIYYISNGHECTADIDTTTIVSFTNGGVYYGYDFNILPWGPSIRTVVSAIQPETQETRPQYESTITGATITQSINVNLYYTWETERVQPEDALAWLAYTRMELISINGYEYTIKEGSSFEGVANTINGTRSKFVTIDSGVASRNRGV